MQPCGQSSVSDFSGFCLKPCVFGKVMNYEVKFAPSIQAAASAQTTAGISRMKLAPRRPPSNPTARLWQENMVTPSYFRFKKIKNKIKISVTRCRDPRGGIAASGCLHLQLPGPQRCHLRAVYSIYIDAVKSFLLYRIYNILYNNIYNDIYIY